MNAHGKKVADEADETAIEQDYQRQGDIETSPVFPFKRDLVITDEHPQGAECKYGEIPALPRM